MQRICFRYFIDDDINGGTMNATTAVTTNGCTGQAAAGPTCSVIGWS